MFERFELPLQGKSDAWYGLTGPPKTTIGIATVGFQRLEEGGLERQPTYYAASKRPRTE